MDLIKLCFLQMLFLWLQIQLTALPQLQHFTTSPWTLTRQNSGWLRSTDQFAVHLSSRKGTNLSIFPQPSSKLPWDSRSSAISETSHFFQIKTSWAHFSFITFDKGNQWLCRSSAPYTLWGLVGWDRIIFLLRLLTPAENTEALWIPQAPPLSVV